MFSWEKTGDRVAIVQMNAELRHAQLELLSAQCATDRLRLRFSVEDIAAHAQRDVLRKALSSANALSDYYNRIAQQIPDPNSMDASNSSVSETKVREMVARVAQYLHEQRDHFRAIGQVLSPEHRNTVAPFFSAAVLDSVRVVVLNGHRLPNPPFYDEAKAHGFTTLPEFTHMASLTFEDVVVFQGEVASRPLFHGLVHAVQYEVLGLQQYAELYVRAFLRARSHVSVPLEAHAFTLESKFAADPSQWFSVEERVRLWVNQGRY